ncbi:Uncharacterized protein conserved in bacteria [Morganella morganii]|nr:Uncharacterized protein conserved in bacteria [Morganella morganii]
MEAQQILDFWFNEATPEQWFKKDTQFDDLIRRRFLKVWEQAAAGECSSWRAHIGGRLAEILVLDQFSRNLWRGDARSFAQDPMALVLAQEAVKTPDYLQLPPGSAQVCADAVYAFRIRTDPSAGGTVV